jgi:hypothetical protein
MARLEDPVDPDVDPGPATLTRLDGELPRYLLERDALLAAAPADVAAHDATVDPARLAAIGVAAARRLAGERDEVLRVGGERLTLPLLGLALEGGEPLQVAPAAKGFEAVAEATWRRLRARPAALRPLDALAAAIQEDVVVMVHDAAARTVRAAYLDVAFPSGWDPGVMAGASFERLHEPVPHGGPLLRSTPAVAAALVQKGPFVRYVWSVASGSGLSRHPRQPRPTPRPPWLASLTLRVERQTTLPLPEHDAALFLIRVYVTPLRTVLTSSARRAALAEALRSMDDALLRYKGLDGFVTPLLAELAAS